MLPPTSISVHRDTPVSPDAPVHTMSFDEPVSAPHKTLVRMVPLTSSGDAPKPSSPPPLDACENKPAQPSVSWRYGGSLQQQIFSSRSRLWLPQAPANQPLGLQVLAGRTLF